MEIVLSIILGLGLAAASGFRVFIPMVLLSLAARSGRVSMAEGFSWIAATPARIMFATATIIEKLGYFIPWVDNLLDMILTPTAIIAGMMVTAACVTDIAPYLKWTLASIAGGGISGVIQSAMTTTPAASSDATGGFGNHVIPGAEIGGSLTMSVRALFVPVISSC